MFSLLSMLLSGDGQCPAVFLHLVVSALVLLITTQLRLSAIVSTNSLFRVPFSCIFLWFLLDSLAFYTSGHQPTFPHIQWSAAFVGFVGHDYGSSWVSNILPCMLIGWNTYSGSIMAGLGLPLLVLAPATVHLCF